MSSATGALSALVPLPAPLALPPGHPRARPDRDQLRAVLRDWAGRWEWTSLSWSALVAALLAVGRSDVPRARLAEGHADALRICDQLSHRPQPGALYGVWASRSGGSGARATASGSDLRLHGEIRFASGAGVLDRALVPVSTAHGHDRLVDLDVSDLPVDTTAWHAAAMAGSHSHTVRLDGVVLSTAALVGPPDGYLHRPGFLPGGVGVAAVWVGGLARVVDLLLARRGPAGGPAAEVRLGRVRTALGTAAAVVSLAGSELDGLLDRRGGWWSDADRDRLVPLCTEARAAVGAALDTALADVRVLAGPAGLAFDAELGAAVDDLGLYALQQTRDGDAAALGRGWLGALGTQA